MTHTYQPALVGLSILIAILASYTALDLASRVTAAVGRARLAWLVGGSVAMGVGIWSMHFVAMLAFRLDVPVSYDGPLLLVSALIAVAASAHSRSSSPSRPRWRRCGSHFGSGATRRGSAVGSSSGARGSWDSRSR